METQRIVQSQSKTYSVVQTGSIKTSKRFHSDIAKFLAFVVIFRCGSILGISMFTEDFRDKLMLYFAKLSKITTLSRWLNDWIGSRETCDWRHEQQLTLLGHDDTQPAKSHIVTCRSSMVSTEGRFGVLGTLSLSCEMCHISLMNHKTAYGKEFNISTVKTICLLIIWPDNCIFLFHGFSLGRRQKNKKRCFPI